ncbi:MAG: hypothetical protein AVDCRST_MAG37-1780 [uncultured Rubrobacteraceae bacterium]|uniref:Peptidase C39-like domain-containing protein n=1 Tax=uncultured Rubrobacteraceae bacterium TaxID=349277 RepID=A0A6J4QJT3_9ACTN|nr:MAG: hypothetical protein AVDCRST_MAG37-1780 [uncultured Rubrobacteraceae bacterium]
MVSDSCASLVRHGTYASLSAGEKDGVVVRRLPTEAGEVRLVCAATPPHTATDRSSFYNGGRYHWGTLTSPVHETTSRFDTLSPSWNATTPDGTWVQLEVRVRSAETWTAWFNMGVWTLGTSLKRHSVNGQEAEGWRVLTDTLQSTGQVFADAYQYRLTLFTDRWDVSPLVQSIFFAISDSRRHGQGPGMTPLRAAWGDSLPVPARSQMVYPNGGEAWCSPTSLSMVMAYWAKATCDGSLDRSVPAVAGGVYDHSYGGWGNWSFNVAYASVHGFEAGVGRMDSVEQVERWVEAGIPVVASVAWDNHHAGQRLSGAPLPRSDGHLLVIRGFTDSGDVIVNDPAGSGEVDVPRVYERAEFSRAWLRTGSGGIVYLVHPPCWRPPWAYVARGSW